MLSGRRSAETGKVYTCMHRSLRIPKKAGSSPTRLKWCSVKKSFGCEMIWFVAAVLRQSTRLVSRRGKSGEKEKEMYVKEFLTDAHVACIMSQDLKAIYRRLKYLLSSPLARPSPPHFCGAFTPPSRRAHTFLLSSYGMLGELIFWPKLVVVGAGFP